MAMVLGIIVGCMIVVQYPRCGSSMLKASCAQWWKPE